MTDSQVARPQRQGNYVPERLRLIEKEVADRYASGESAAALAREYGISKHGVHGAARRQGITIRGKADAGLLYRRVERVLTADEEADERPVAQQVAEKLGYATHKGLSYDRAFQSACARERRRRSAERYEAIDKRRKEHLYRIPAWQPTKQIADFYEMASDLGLEVDHIIPLQGENVCGLNVMSNLRLLSSEKNGAKQNKCAWVSDPLIGPPKGFGMGSERATSSD